MAQEVAQPVPGLSSRFASKKPQSQGWVYVIGGETGLVKIGWTSNVGRRLKDLQCGSPVRLAVLATVRGASWLEWVLHGRFKEHRSHGEWFHRSVQIEDFIADNPPKNYGPRPDPIAQGSAL